MQAIARCNGALLVEEGKRIGVVQQAGEYLTTMIWGLALGTIILAVNGLVQLFLQPLVGVALLAAALLFGFVTSKVKRRLDERNAPVVPDRPWLVFDLETRKLLNGAGRELAALEKIAVRRCFNVFSSSKALCVDVGDDSIVIARGNPFGDDVGDIEDALRKRGINVA